MVANPMHYFRENTFKLWFNNPLFIYYPTYPLVLKLSPNMLNHISNSVFFTTSKRFTRKEFIKIHLSREYTFHTAIKNPITITLTKWKHIGEKPYSSSLPCKSMSATASNHSPAVHMNPPQSSPTMAVDDVLI